MKIDKINELDGKRFQDLLFRIKNIDSDFYFRIINNYFDAYSNMENPVITSWDNDPDEVWDAEAFLVEYCNNNPASEITKLIYIF